MFAVRTGLFATRPGSCRHISLLAGLLTVVIAADANAIFIRHDRPVADHNTIGRKSAFASSGYLADSRDGFEIASATLVSPTKVLTAAHVVDSDGDLVVDRPNALKKWTFGTQVNIPASLSANVASVKINPAYKGGKAAFDLAVITLRTPICNVPPGLMSATNAVGRRGGMVGYGYQGNGAGRSISGANDKLGAYNQISVLQDGTYKTDFDSPRQDRNTFGSSLGLTYEGTTASGDSGSALWAEFSANVWRVVGVLNGGYNAKGFDSEYGDISIYASLQNAKNISFLKAQGLSISGAGLAATSAGAGTSRSAPFDAQVVPEPATALLVVVAISFLSRRPRQGGSASHNSDCFT